MTNFINKEILPRGMAGFWLKSYYAYGDYIVAVCDEELLGKELEEEDVRLFISPSYYGGELVNEERVKEELNRATVGNLVGERVIKIAEELGLVDRGGVRYIKGVPHAQFVVFFFQGI